MAHKCMSLCMMSDDIHSVIFLSSHLDLLCTCTCVQLPTGKRFFIFVNSKPQTYLKKCQVISTLFDVCPPHWSLEVLHHLRQTDKSLPPDLQVCVCLVTWPSKVKGYHHGDDRCISPSPHMYMLQREDASDVWVCLRSHWHWLPLRLSVAGIYHVSKRRVSQSPL